MTASFPLLGPCKWSWLNHELDLWWGLLERSPVNVVIPLPGIYCIQQIQWSILKAFISRFDAMFWCNNLHPSIHLAVIWHKQSSLNKSLMVPKWQQHNGPMLPIHKKGAVKTVMKSLKPQNSPHLNLIEHLAIYSIADFQTSSLSRNKNIMSVWQV